MKNKIDEFRQHLIDIGFSEVESIYNSHVEYIKLQHSNLIIYLYPDYYEVGYVDFKDAYFKVIENRYTLITSLHNNIFLINSIIKREE